MSKTKRFQEEPPTAKWVAEDAGGADRFPDKLQVREFAERLLQRKPEGAYELVRSERRSSLNQPSSRGVRARVPDDTTLPALGPRTESVPASSTVAQVSKTFPSASNGDESPSDPGECLSEDAILAFVQGRLRGAELVSAHGHLDLCTDCQSLIAEAAHAVSAVSSDRHGADSATGALRVGTMLNDRYRIQRFVARGGMGEVYEAYDRVLRERIALKTVTASVSDSPRAVRRLMAEVQLARRVSHPNVCRIYDLGAHIGDDGRTLHFLSMEFVPGMSLGEKLEHDGPLAVDEAVLIAQQLLSGLHAAHEAGILHRDFKPDNIMLRPARAEAPRAVVMDFGLARAIEVDPARLTTGADQPLIGTLSYMAPEQVEGGRLTAGTDIFAFGIVLFEMLTGCLPFVGASPAATALKRLKEAPPPPSDFAPSVPGYLNRVVLRCLARNPEERYTNAADVLADLSGRVARPGPLTTAQRNRRWVVAASAGALVAGSVALWVVASKHAPSSTVSNGDPLAVQPELVKPSLVAASSSTRSISDAEHVDAVSKPQRSVRPAPSDPSASPKVVATRAQQKVRQPGLPAQNTPLQSADSAAQTRPTVPPNGDQASVEVSVQGVPQVHGTSEPAEANGLLVPSVFASDQSGQRRPQPKTGAGRAQ